LIWRWKRCQFYLQKNYGGTLMILIYVDQITERLFYTLGFIFKDREIPYSLTNDFVKFEQSEKAKFNYSDRIFEKCININPSSVIFDENIGVYEIDKGLFFEFLIKHGK
ncbi:MAG: hypothetical protein EB087_01455, partial [Flavobacteriales bacterium]|nr:hypothetical protein [Flavobacteriales bacterium]